MNIKKNNSAFKQFWKIFSKLSEYVAILSLLAFFCLKIDLLERLPGWANVLFSEETQIALKNFNANYLLAIIGAGFAFSPYVKREIIDPLSVYSVKDLVGSGIAIGCLSGAGLLSNQCKGYGVGEWQRLFNHSQFSEFLFSFRWVKDNFLSILCVDLILLALIAFSFTSFARAVFFRPMAKSFRELPLFTWPKWNVVLRFTCAICIFTLFAALLIAAIDWIALRLMTFILSWTASND